MTLDNIKLDIDYVRSQFPAFKDPLSKDWSFFENAGGSYVPQNVIDKLTEFKLTRSNFWVYSISAWSPFSITADLARNVLKGTEQIQLEMPKADIAINEGGWLVISAKSGLYDQKKKSLNLTGNVNLFHDSGYEFTTTDAQINLKDGIALSNSPVNGQGPFGELMSQGIRIEEKGKRIFFSGKTKLIMSPKAFKEWIWKYIN